MDVEAYLDRIGLGERPPATLAGLTTLHRAHLRAIPYENLDVQLGRPLTLAQAPMLEKVIGRRRGGWCYEMNGTLGWALAELGFDVRRATGAVKRCQSSEGGGRAFAKPDPVQIRLDVHSPSRSSCTLAPGRAESAASTSTPANNAALALPRAYEVAERFEVDVAA